MDIALKNSHHLPANLKCLLTQEWISRLHRLPEMPFPCYMVNRMGSSYNLSELDADSSLDFVTLGQVSY